MHRRTVIGGLGAIALGTAMPTSVAAANSLPRSAPIRVARVGLRTRDAETLSDWYQKTLGLREIARTGTTIQLGVEEQTLLELTERTGLSLAGPQQAGLFHTAFLLPSRRDLANWIAKAIAERIPVDGTADHRVSEAIYLTDPEGNGIEIYADTPQDSWQWVEGQVQMGTFPMDIDGIMEERGVLPPSWQSAPAGTTIGHVHMKVGNARQAGLWWHETLGFDVVRARDDAVFLSTGGYHHHIAVNEWLSAGAGRHSLHETGLDTIDLARQAPSGTLSYEDDWGTIIRLT